MPHVIKLGSIALTIWGDPIVGRALVVLLRSSGYQARFLSALSLNQALSLEGVDARTAAQIERAVDESFVAAFRAVMLVSSGLALASALVAALLWFLR